MSEECPVLPANHSPLSPTSHLTSPLRPGRQRLVGPAERPATAPGVSLRDAGDRTTVVGVARPNDAAVVAAIQSGKHVKEHCTGNARFLESSLRFSAQIHEVGTRLASVGIANMPSVTRILITPPSFFLNAISREELFLVHFSEFSSTISML